MRILAILVGATLLATSAMTSTMTSASAADYRDAPYHPRRVARYGVIPDPGIRQAPPLYYVYAPPRFVQDTRTGEPGHFVVPQPNFFERLFGPFKDYGY